LWAAFRGSLLALLMPLLVIFGLVGGVATTSEIGAIAAFYAALVSTVVYREASLRQLLSGVVQAALDAGRVLIIIAISGAFIWIVARLSVANALAVFLLDLKLGPTAILSMIAVFLILAGTILEPVTILVVLVPMMVPAALASGIDITHLGIVVVLSTAIGMITPPVGILIYITAAQARAPALDVVRESTPFLLALFALLATVVLVPQVTLWLPSLN
jgi:tripartite ATP-independent transporter DctM subunit